MKSIDFYAIDIMYAWCFYHTHDLTVAWNTFGLDRPCMYQYAIYFRRAYICFVF